MPIEILAALVGFGGVIILQIIFFAYKYGKLEQQVRDMCKATNDRLDKIDRILNGHRTIIIDGDKRLQ